MIVVFNDLNSWKEQIISVKSHRDPARSRSQGSSYPNTFIAIRLTIQIYKYRLRWSPFLAFRTKNGPPQSRERNSPIRPGGQGGTLTPSAQSGLFTVRSIRGRRRRSRPSRALRARHSPPPEKRPPARARPNGGPPHHLLSPTSLQTHPRAHRKKAFREIWYRQTPWLCCG